MAENKQLMNVPEAVYGENYKNDFMTQYRDFVASTSQISGRRHQANQFFSTINTMLLMASGLIPTAKVNFNWQIALAGGLLCLIWKHMIDGYSSLNSAKFKVILEMEEHLPAATYTMEWEYLQSAKASSLSSTESKVPWLFMGAYLAVYITNVVSKLL